MRRLILVRHCQAAGQNPVDALGPAPSGGWPPEREEAGRRGPVPFRGGAPHPAGAPPHRSRVRASSPRPGRRRRGPRSSPTARTSPRRRRRPGASGRRGSGTKGGSTRRRCIAGDQQHYLLGRQSVECIRNAEGCFLVTRSERVRKGNPHWHNSLSINRLWQSHRLGYISCIWLVSTGSQLSNLEAQETDHEESIPGGPGASGSPLPYQRGGSSRSRHDHARLRPRLPGAGYRDSLCPKAKDALLARRPACRGPALRVRPALALRLKQATVGAFPPGNISQPIK